LQRYVIRRLLISVPILLGITVMVFIMINLAPGDPVLAMLNPEAKFTADDLAILRHQYGLDRPLPVRYAIWLRAVLNGNLGRSMLYKEPTTALIAWRLPPTIQLMGAALLISFTLGTTIGIFTAVKQYSLADLLLTPLAYVWVSAPGFFAALTAIYLFSVRWKLLPTGGYSSASATSLLLDLLRHMALPALVLGLEMSAAIARYTRSSVLEILRQDYMTVARAKGLSEIKVLLRHGIPNALIPILTILGMRIPALFGGSVIIESVFNWPGIGSLYVAAVANRDYSVVMGLSLISATAVLLSNLITDISYALVDPRVRYS
jgi:peptide/nickel transport system permease protein